MTLRINDCTPNMKDIEVVYISCIIPDSLNPICGLIWWNLAFPRQEMSRKDMHLQRPSHRQRFMGRFLFNGSSLLGLAASSSKTSEEENQSILSIWMLTPLLHVLQSSLHAGIQMNNETTSSLCMRGHNNNFKQWFDILGNTDFLDKTH